MPIEIEAQSLEQVDEAIRAGADIILLDNLSTSDMREAVRRIAGRAKVEISGGVTLERIPELAETGADYVSVGALTHSAPAADLSFELEPMPPRRARRARMPEPLPEDLAAALAASADRRGAFGQPVVFHVVDRLHQRRRADAGRRRRAAGSRRRRLRADGGSRPARPRVVLAAGCGPLPVGRRPRSAVAPMLTLAGGVAVADGIRRATGLPVQIKWPNDVVVEDAHAPGRRRKLAGILAEGIDEPKGCSTSCSASASTCALPPIPPSWPRG